LFGCYELAGVELLLAASHVQPTAAASEAPLQPTFAPTNGPTILI
jgi:hypothetical protein